MKTTMRTTKTIKFVAIIFLTFTFFSGCGRKDLSTDNSQIKKANADSPSATVVTTTPPANTSTNPAFVTLEDALTKVYFVIKKGTMGNSIEYAYLTYKSLDDQKNYVDKSIYFDSKTMTNNTVILSTSTEKDNLSWKIKCNDADCVDSEMTIYKLDGEYKGEISFKNKSFEFAGKAFQATSSSMPTTIPSKLMGYLKDTSSTYDYRRMSISKFTSGKTILGVNVRAHPSTNASYRSDFEILGIVDSTTTENYLQEGSNYGISSSMSTSNVFLKYTEDKEDVIVNGARTNTINPKLIIYYQKDEGVQSFTFSRYPNS